MTRILIATALATTLGTASFAATDAQMQQVDGFNSGIDTSGFSARDYTIAYGIVTSGMSHGEKTGQLRALAANTSMDMGTLMISAAELSRIQQYAPDVDVSSLSQAQAETALAVTYSGGSEGTIKRQVQNILGGADMDAATQASVTAGQANILRGYVATADLSGLTQNDLNIALSVAYSGMSRSDKTQQIEALVNN